MSEKKPDISFNSIKSKMIKLLDPDYVEDKTDDFTHSGEGKSGAEEFKFNESLSAKAKDVINDFIESAPLIEEAGFRISGLEIELSVIPKLIPHFEKLADVDDATRIKIIEKASDKRLIRLLLKALFKADNLQKSLKIGRLSFSGIEIEITAIPAVRLIYKNILSEPSEKTDLI